MSKQVICYGVTRSRNWQQEWYESASRHARIRAAQLRKLGYRVCASSQGSQVTREGRVNMTLLTIILTPEQECEPIPSPDVVERL